MTVLLWAMNIERKLKNWNIQVIRCIKKIQHCFIYFRNLLWYMWNTNLTALATSAYIPSVLMYLYNITQSPSSAWFHTSTVKYTRTVLFKVITHQVVVIPFWCFVTTYWSLLQGSVLHPCPLKMGPWILDAEDGTDRFVLNCQ